MNDKGLILKQMISNPNRNSDAFFTPESLNDMILKDKTEVKLSF